MRWRAIGAGIVTLGALAALAMWLLSGPTETLTWRTVTVTRGDARQVVSSTGTLEAVTAVEVGTQVSGIVSEILVDFNDQVAAGDVLARIDTSLLEADVASAKARLVVAVAERDRSTVELARAESAYAKGALAERDLDDARVAAKVADAEVVAAKVTLDRSRSNLGYATITAPIAGTVVTIDVDVGQTVNAGMTAPRLFVLAGDLARMQIVANVDEADIGRVSEGQSVEFTVQAYPEAKFAGSVRQVRLQSTVAENVVTYAVVIEAPNEDRRLLPGMTAVVDFVVAEARDVLCAPNAALRFTPEPALVAGGATQEPPKANGAEGKRPEAASGATGRRKPGGRGDRGTLWVVEGDLVKAVPVKTGVRGAACTEVTGEGLTDDLEVVAGMERTTTTGTSPFQAPASQSGRRFGGL